MSLVLPELISERLVVRPFEMSDLAAIGAILDACFGAAPAADRRFWLDWTVRSYRAYAAMDEPPYGDRAVVLAATGELVGSVGVVPSYGPFDRLRSVAAECSNNLTTKVRPHVCRPEIGLFWAIGPGFRGHGYAAEAARALVDWLFRELRVARLVATTEHDNVASIAVMRRLGMTVERDEVGDPEWFQVVGLLENPEA